MGEMPDKIVVLTESQLEQIIFDACTSACGNLFNGLSKRFMFQLEEDVRKILYEIDELNR